MNSSNIGSSFRNGNKSLIGNSFIFIFIGVVVVLLVIYGFVRLGFDYADYKNNSQYLVEDTMTGSDSKIIKGYKLLPSYDQKYGLEFSYAFWIYVDGNTFNDTTRWKHIMHKGNSSAMPLQAPGFWLYPSENKMAINMNTFDNVKESCDIGNLPLNKWFYMTVCVTGKQVDVYVNARLKKRCKLSGIIKQNYGDLYIAKWGGFNGFLSRIQYFNHSLPYFRIEQLFKNGPSERSCVQPGMKPPYLANNYWMTTGFPDTVQTPSS